MRLPTTADLAARHARVRASLEALSLDALIVTAPTNIRYLTNHTGSAGTVVLTADAIHLLVDFRYQASVQGLQTSASACPTLRIWTVPDSSEAAVRPRRTELPASGGGVEAGHRPVARPDRIARSAPSPGAQIAWRPTERVVDQPPTITDAWEIALWRDAARRLTTVAAAA